MAVVMEIVAEERVPDCLQKVRWIGEDVNLLSVDAEGRTFFRGTKYPARFTVLGWSISDQAFDLQSCRLDL